MLDDQVRAWCSCSFSRGVTAQCLLETTRNHEFTFTTRLRNINEMAEMEDDMLKSELELELRVASMLTIILSLPPPVLLIHHYNSLL